jgi:hypothetical protein
MELKLVNNLKALVDDLMNYKYAFLFKAKVDEINIPDYYDVIENPMDLSIIKLKLDQ